MKFVIGIDKEMITIEINNLINAVFAFDLADGDIGINRR